MHRITTLLQKINDLASKDKDAGVIDIDLMMDYTRVLYADLHEWRARVSFNTSLDGGTATAATTAQPVQHTEPEKKDDSTPTPVKTPQESQEPIEKVVEESPVKQPVINIPTPSADIRKWIGINDKYQFISEMFGNDKDGYEAIMSQINESDDYNLAVDMLDEVHAERGWNDDDPTIQSFYGILSKFFSER
jgi:hypothetical protein